PGEAVLLRPCDLLQSEQVDLGQGLVLKLKGVWAHLPAQHKTARKGHKRVILFGPKAQAVLEPLLDRDPQAHLFSPAESLAWFRAQWRAARKTRVQPSQEARSRPAQSLTRQPRTSFTVPGYDLAIRQACKRAKVHCWSAHRLRHNAATSLTREFGI